MKRRLFAEQGLEINRFFKQKTTKIIYE